MCLTGTVASKCFSDPFSLLSEKDSSNVAAGPWTLKSRSSGKFSACTCGRAQLSALHSYKHRPKSVLRSWISLLGAASRTRSADTSLSVAATRLGPFEKLAGCRLSCLVRRSAALSITSASQRRCRPLGMPPFVTVDMQATRLASDPSLGSQADGPSCHAKCPYRHH